VCWVVWDLLLLVGLFLVVGVPGLCFPSIELRTNRVMILALVSWVVNGMVDRVDVVVSLGLGCDVWLHLLCVEWQD
jgi:hypothetical protein